MTKLTSGQGSVLPEGVVLSPEAKRCLEKALTCLDGGLLVASWHWCEKARVELDKLTDNEPASWLVEGLAEVD